MSGLVFGDLWNGLEGIEPDGESASMLRLSAAEDEASAVLREDAALVVLVLRNLSVG